MSEALTAESLDARTLREYANRLEDEDTPGGWYVDSADERKRLENASAAGDSEARKRLVLAHMPLVRAYVDQYDSDSPYRLDLLQEGYKALLIAADKFQPSRARTFGTYAFAVVERKIDALKARLRSSVSLGREALRFQWKYKKARRDFEQEHQRRPWSGQLIQVLTRGAVEELRPVWRDKWPEDENVTERLEALSQGLTLETDVEDRDKALTCISVLLAGIGGAEYPDRLDDESRLGGDYESPGESVSLHELVPDSRAIQEAEILDDIDRERQGRPSREQERRNRYRAKRQALWGIANVPLLLSSRMRFALMLRLGADGRGSRDLDEVVEEVSRVNREPVRRDSVARTIARAVQRIREYVEGTGDGPAGYFNPWHGLELAASYGDTGQREAAARANRQHVLNGGGAGRWFNPYTDPPPNTSGQGRISNPYPEDPWQDAIRAAMRPDPSRPDRDWPGVSEGFEPDTRAGADPVTGRACRSAPARPIGPKARPGEWRRIQPLSRMKLGKAPWQYDRFE